MGSLAEQDKSSKRKVSAEYMVDDTRLSEVLEKIASVNKGNLTNIWWHGNTIEISGEVPGYRGRQDIGRLVRGEEIRKTTGAIYLQVFKYEGFPKQSDPNLPELLKDYLGHKCLHPSE